MQKQIETEIPEFVKLKWLTFYQLKDGFKIFTELIWTGKKQRSKNILGNWYYKKQMTS